MIKYGIIELTAEYGSISIATQRSQIVRHYPTTDESDAHDMGRGLILIAMTIICVSDTERIRIESALSSPLERNLQLNDLYYTRVVPDDKFNIEAIINTSDGKWYIKTRFIALNPIPYDVLTGGVLY